MNSNPSDATFRESMTALDAAKTWLIMDLAVQLGSLNEMVSDPNLYTAR